MLRETAIKETSISALIENRTKIDVDSVINTVLTIDKIDLVKMKNKNTGEYDDVPIIIFKEKPDNFIFGGICILNIVKAWVEQCGSIDTVNETLQAETVQIKIEKQKTKSGNNINKVTVL